MKRRLKSGQAGVSLVEAIVALGVMAFGMLALVGVQATLRGSSDLARQRTEAMRIAQETVENFRGYAALTGSAGVDFDEITTVARAAWDATDTALEDRLNTTFFSTITAPAVANSAPMRPLAVTIDWTDRNGQAQSVELRTVIAGLPPELPGSLALPPSRDPFSAPMARHRNVPLSAFSLPATSLSVFKPPQSSAGTVGWLFNNLTGQITGLCTLDAAVSNETMTEAAAQNCADGRTATTAQLISGYVRFATAGTTVQAEEPSGTLQNLDVVFNLFETGTYPAAPQCFDDATDASGVLRPGSEVAYFCLVYSNSSGTLIGRTRVRPQAYGTGLAWTIGEGGSDYKVCRYTPLTEDTGTRNADHPLDYTSAASRPGESLANQNFLVIPGVDACPSETAGADLFNSNLRVHQNSTTAYPNL